MLKPPVSVIGAYYDADAHCIACAEQAFGSALYSRNTPEDHEGNPIALIWDYDGSPEDLYCDDCQRLILRGAYVPRLFG